MKHIIKRSTLLIMLPALLLVFSSCEPKRNNDENNNDRDSKDVAENRNEDKFDEKDSEKNAQFVVDAVASNLAEIRLADLAEKRAQNSEVKEIASMLKKHHAALLDKLKSYASKNVISVPTEVSDKVDNEMENLSDDKNFDKKWCEEVKDMHEKSIEKFEDASTSLSDAELKNLANDALPTLRTHYDKLAACDEKLQK